MRLIDTETGTFAEFTDLSTAPLYAILSHTWDPDGEQSYQDVMKIQEKYGLAAHQSSASPASGHPSDAITSAPFHIVANNPQATVLPGTRHWISRIRTSFFRKRPSLTRRSIWDPDSGLSEKVWRACEIARNDGYAYIWIDSSCIDKTSSSELSEAINSMFDWYRGAQICYALLSDVPSDKDVRANYSRFRYSRWFTRAWTLQELIAPRTVVFLSQDWKGLGTKDALADLIQDITHIDRDILTHRTALADESVAERMRWAAKREATRVEDVAYSLLGIFGITMPTLYGESEYAFRRLQEEILRRIPDRTLFVWGQCVPIPQEPSSIRPDDMTIKSPIASSPHSFASLNGKINRLSQEDIESLGLPVTLEDYTSTPHGICTRLFFIPLQALNPSLSVRPDRVDGVADSCSWHLVLLGSQRIDNDRRLLGKLCSITCTKSRDEFLYVPGTGDIRCEGKISNSDRSYYNSVIFTISFSDLVSTQILAQLKPKTVYLPHPKPSMSERRASYEFDTTWPSTISLSTWARDALRPYGYTISDLCPTEDPPQDSSFLTLSNASSNIHIRYRHMLTRSRTGHVAMVVEAGIWILSPNSDDDVQRDLLQRSPPYTSAIWVAHKPWTMTLPLRTIHLVTQSGDEVTLRLGLGIATPVHCHAHVEVATNVASPTCQLSTRAQVVSEGLRDYVIWEPHRDLKLTMLGSIRRALEARGYSVHLERPDPNTGNSHSLSLIISNVDSGFTVSIHYFHILCPRTHELVVVTRVTLELHPRGASHNSEGYQDGPFVARWSDHARAHRELTGWRWCQEGKQIGLTAPTGDSLTLHLGLDLAWKSEYYLLIDIEHDGSCSQAEPTDCHPPEEPHRVHNPHSCIILTLPAHIKRALQTHGYDVRFEGPNEDHPDPYHLTLSDANLTIKIDYSYHLSTPVDGDQGLTFRACVTTLSLQGSQDDAEPATQPNGQIVDWNAWDAEGGWHWNLLRKDIKLPLPTGGLQLTLRLGLYLVWLSEYCLTVEVNPPSPLSRTTRHDLKNLGSAHGSTHSRNSGEDAGDGASMQETAAGEAYDHDVACSGVIAPVALPSPGVEDAEVEGAGASDKAE